MAAAEDLLLPSEMETNPVRWPTVASARGKIVFLLFDYGGRPVERDAQYIAKSGDRQIFPSEKEIEGLHAAWQSRNDPAEIGKGQPLVSGLLLDTEADTLGIQEVARRQMALANSANFYRDRFPNPICEAARR